MNVSAGVVQFLRNLVPTFSWACPSVGDLIVKGKPRQFESESSNNSSVVFFKRQTSQLGGAITIRTNLTNVTFRRPFVLGGFDEKFPEGTYTLETDEELLEGISFLAYWRISTLIHLKLDPKYPGRMRTLAIDPVELDAALARDQAT